MKKLVILCCTIGALCMPKTGMAVSIDDSLIIGGSTTTQCWSLPSGCSTAGSSCTSSLCTTCKDSTSQTISGVTIYYQKSITTTCDSSTGEYSCSCTTTSTTYECSSGYYGTATNALSRCTACPDNATCAGGNGSTFVCNVGYYQASGTLYCTLCPDNATCIDSTILCNLGYYLADSTCNSCPTLDDGQAGTTDVIGTTTITDCYIPDGTISSDTTGDYEYVNDCYYTE